MDIGGALLDALVIGAEQLFSPLFQVADAFFGLSASLLALALRLEITITCQITQPLLGLTDELIALACRLLLAAGTPEGVAHGLLHITDALARAALGLIGLALSLLLLVAREATQRLLSLAQQTLALTLGLILVHSLLSLSISG
jgi:hypothetical protein